MDSAQEKMLSCYVSGVASPRARERTLESVAPLACPLLPADATLDTALAAAVTPWVLCLESGEQLAAGDAAAIDAGLRRVPEEIDGAALSFSYSLRGQTLAFPALERERRVRVVRPRAAALLDVRVPAPGEGVCPLDELVVQRSYESLLDMANDRFRLARQAPAMSGAFAERVREAYLRFAARHQSAVLGDDGHAAATLLAWEAVVEGLVSWEKSGRTSSLGEAFSLPVATVQRDELPTKLEKEWMAQLEQAHAEVLRAQADTQRLRKELDRIQGSVPWKLYQQLRRLLPPWR